MDEEVEKVRKQLQETHGEEQKRLYVEYCDKLVTSVEKGEMTEEEAAYEMVEVFMGNLGESSECDAIFDAAADTEIPREMSHDHRTGQWDQKTADVLKQREWKKVLGAINKAKRSLKK